MIGGFVEGGFGSLEGNELVIGGFVEGGFGLLGVLVLGFDENVAGNAPAGHERAGLTSGCFGLRTN